MFDKEDLRDWRIWLVVLAPWAAAVAIALAFWAQSNLMAVVAVPLMVAAVGVTILTIGLAPLFLPMVLWGLVIGGEGRAIKAWMVHTVSIAILVISYVVFAINAHQKPAADSVEITKPATD
jgi:hypothetical protein